MANQKTVPMGKRRKRKIKKVIGESSGNNSQEISGEKVVENHNKAVSMAISAANKLKKVFSTTISAAKALKRRG